MYSKGMFWKNLNRSEKSEWKNASNIFKNVLIYVDDILKNNINNVDHIHLFIAFVTARNINIAPSVFQIIWINKKQMAEFS